MGVKWRRRRCLLSVPWEDSFFSGNTLWTPVLLPFPAAAFPGTEAEGGEKVLRPTWTRTLRDFTSPAVALCAPPPSPSWNPGPSQRETEAEGQKTTFCHNAVHIFKGSWWPGPWLRKARVPARGHSPSGLAALLHQEVAAYVPPAHFHFPCPPLW